MPARKKEVLELPVARKRSGIENDVVMDMGFVRMSGDSKRVLSLREAHSQFVPQPVGILRCDLSRLKGLPDLIRDDISLVFLARDLLVLPFGKQELRRRRLRLTGIGSDKFLDRILRIIQPLRQTLHYDSP